MATIVGENYRQDRQRAYLVDGGVLSFDCDVCGRHLVNLQITRPDYDIKANYKVECPYCKEENGGVANYSKPQYVEGGFALEGDGEKKENGEEIVRTMPTGGFKTLSDGTVVIEMMKFKNA